MADAPLLQRSLLGPQGLAALTALMRVPALFAFEIGRASCRERVLMPV